MLEIKNLKKTFNNGTQALDGVFIDIKEGEFVALLGPSGSGKTTLLRSINGLEKIDQGTILFDDDKIDNNSLSEVRKKTGMIFQEFNLINNLSAINNVLTGILNSETSTSNPYSIFLQKIKKSKL